MHAIGAFNSIVNQPEQLKGILDSDPPAPIP